MPTLAQLMRAEIARAVSREIRAAGLGKLTRRVAQLEKRVASCETGARATAGRPARATVRGRGKVDRRTLRFSPATLKKLRGKLRVTQQELAALLNVSGNAVWQWEAGRAKPRAKYIAAMRELRTLGSRAARKRLK